MNGPAMTRTTVTIHQHPSGPRPLDVGLGPISRPMDHPVRLTAEVGSTSANHHGALRHAATRTQKESHMNKIVERVYLTYAMLVGRVEDREKGASMTEYAILVAVMAGLVVILVGLLGDKISTFISNINITT